MTPASSPTDEKPSLDSLNEQDQQLQDPQQHPQQRYRSSGDDAQGPTPPLDFTPPNQHTVFNNPFASQNQHLAHRESVNTFAQHPGQPLHPGTPLQLQSHQQQGPIYAFNRAYQTGTPGQFPPLQQRNNSGEVRDVSAPGTPGPNRVPIPRRGTGNVDNITNDSKGPMSKEVNLPPRPKPGRKPLENAEDAQDRRRMQNRQAQRNFRDRRTQRVSDMSTTLQEQQREFRREQASYTNQLAQKDQQIIGLRNEVAKLREENRKLREGDGDALFRRDTTTEPLSSLGDPANLWDMNRSAPLSSAQQTPRKRARTSSKPTDLETDFTTLGRRTGAFRITGPVNDNNGNSNSNATTSGTNNDNNDNGAAEEDAASSSDNDADALMAAEGMDDKQFDCGFCTDTRNCICRQVAADTAQTLLGMSGRNVNTSNGEGDGGMKA